VILLSAIEPGLRIGVPTLLGLLGFAVWAGWWLRGWSARRGLRRALRRRVPNPAEMERACAERTGTRPTLSAYERELRARSDFELSADTEPERPLMGKRAPRGRR
jgi:hypothetical protein